jgi:hypothetical protein
MLVRYRDNDDVSLILVQNLTISSSEIIVPARRALMNLENDLDGGIVGRGRAEG